MTKVLVIGGAGYIGSHVVKELLENGFEVTVFDNMSSGLEENLFPEAGFIKGDILDRPALDKAVAQNVNAVVHLAGKKAVGESMEKPEIYAQNNITGAVNILNAMVENGVKHLVFSSSAAVYGMPQYLPLDEKHPLKPINFYGYTKLVTEQLMSWYATLKDFNYIALRYFNAVGYAADKSITGREKNSQNLLPIVMEVATGKRESFHIFGSDYKTPDGTCRRDYIHVSDLAAAHLLAIRKLMADKKSYVLNLGTGKPTSVKEIVDATENADATLAQKVLGWTPRYTNIEEIIRTTWNLEI